MKVESVVDNYNLSGNIYLNGELLTNLVIPENITSIRSNAFAGCEFIKSVTIPKGVISIGDHAFDGCNSINEIYITDIAAWCNLEVGYNNSNLSGNIYLNGELLTNLVIPENITSIRGNAFAGCEFIESVTIPEGVTRIGSYAFYGCSSLTSITIPNSLTDIYYNSFYGCNQLENIYIFSITSWCNLDALYDALTGKLFLNGQLITTLVIPNDVKKIRASAFIYNPVDTIIFCGTEEEWNNIEKESGWDRNFGGYQINYHEYNIDSEINENEHNGICKYCGKTAIFAHSYSNWSNHNETQHVKECECGNKVYENHNFDDGEVTTPATHINEGVMTYTCLDCGATRTEPIDKTKDHAYGNWSKHNETQHVKECECGDKIYEDHDWNDGEVTTSATHIKEGEMTYTCRDCGETRTESIDKTKNHSYGKWEKYNDTQHVKECECGDKVYEDHNCYGHFSDDWHDSWWNNGKCYVSKEPTHTEEGEIVHICGDCGGTTTESIDKLPNHRYENYTKFDDEKHKGECECGDVTYKDHFWDAWRWDDQYHYVSKEPTHTEEGEMTYVCYICKATKTEPIEKLPNHTYDKFSKYNETQHIKECECGDKVYSKHKWDAGVVTTPATHIKEGETTYTCHDCGETKTQSIKKLTAHEYGDWQMVNNEQHMKKCACGDEIYIEHILDNYVDIKEATHTEGGIRKYICSDCHGEVTVETPMIDHDFLGYVKVDDKMHKRDCSCGFSEIIEHDYGESGEVIKESTVDEEGIMIFRCADCGAEMTVYLPKQTPDETIVSDSETEETQNTETDTSIGGVIDETDSESEIVSENETTASSAGCGGNISFMIISLPCVLTAAYTFIKKKKEY